MEQVFSDFGVMWTAKGEVWLSKTEGDKTVMFKQFDSYEDAVIAVQTSDLDDLWNKYKNKGKNEGRQFK